MNQISKFRGRYRFLSNFWMESDGFSNEHYFQALKTLHPWEQIAVLNTETPREAKKLGQLVTLRDDWDDIKDNVMYQLVKVKFSYWPSLKLMLFATGNAELIEGNEWNDTYWGVCRGKGQNKLGKILMRVRGELHDEDIVRQMEGMEDSIY